MDTNFNVPTEIKMSEDVLIGDVEKFMELFEGGYYAEQWKRLRAAAIKGIHSGASETVQGSTIHVEATDLAIWVNPNSNPVVHDEPGESETP